MSEENKYKTDQVLLRSYPKVIFFWPLLVYSFIAWLIQFFFPDPIAWLGNIWMIVFFANLFTIAFDFSTVKFFIMLLAIVVIGLLVFFLVIPNVDLGGITVEFNLGLSAYFYFAMMLILGIVLLLVVIGSYFDYYRVERNEIYHKTGLFSDAERYPVKSLRMKKQITDVFEFFILRAGSLTLLPGRADEVIYLPTVLNINKKEKQLDYLLSHISVEPDEID
ncbi:MAG: conserved membrane protein of unknown function [Promethearchaeota archaeon]|nr:MAG: conserved membrane protein of unknown function [Candidatus Lokiarchaeota archaeon]